MFRKKTHELKAAALDKQVPVELVLVHPQNNPFGDVPPGAAQHFELYYLAAAAALTRRVIRFFGTREAVFAEFPFLQDYDERLAGREPDDLSDEDADGWWEKSLFAWEKNCRIQLPLRDLREKFEIDHSSVILLVTIGLIEEDIRFGAVFELLNQMTDENRLTYGVLNGWRREYEPEISAHEAVRQLLDPGLIYFGNTEEPRSSWNLRISTQLWDVLRGEKQFSAGDRVNYTAPADLLPLDDLILPETLCEELAILPGLIERGDIRVLVIRGPRHNGRKTILGGIAHSLNMGLLEVDAAKITGDDNWRITGTLAVLLNAMPVFCLNDIGPSETVEFPALTNSLKICGITLGKHGGVGGGALEKSLTLNVSLPDEKYRRLHWRDALIATDQLDEISERFRLSGGNIRRVAELSASYARLADREKIEIADVQKAARSLNRQALDTLAAYLEPLDAGWDFLAVREETMSDLRELEQRCRIREGLQQHVGPSLSGQLQAGVRALFNGPSGTGKTYAARLLASALQKDLYRLDLSTIVNKYIGETEKNLARVFAFVEELDVILLLDEGDSLLTRRTNVSNATDRYANLETNYLLQRLESFEGILIVTTNASERIDTAFQRRMDTVVEFAAPEPAERRRIWDLHLPVSNNIGQNFLFEIIEKCELTGGQIRNVALHAAALALAEKKQLSSFFLEAAVRREYRKIGAVCPLRTEDGKTHSNADRW